MDGHTLGSDRLQVELAGPGDRYTGSRFDWTTQVHQIIFEGKHQLLTREKESVESPSAQGWGLAGEFGIETPVGFEDCPTGAYFPKIGIGRLQRPDEKAYHFARPYQVEAARFSVRAEGSAALLVTADQAPDRGFGWFLKRHWSVRGAELTLTTTLANTGSKPLATEEYIHNFFGLDGVPVGEGWSLSVPGLGPREGLSAWVDPESLMVLRDSKIAWTKTPTQDFFLSDRRTPAPKAWTLAHSPSGLTVTETVDFTVANFNLWGRGHVVSPELYYHVQVAPGASLAWSRRWTFRRGG